MNEVWEIDEEMQAFQALPYRDKLRVSRCLTRGEAPADPRLAAAAVELAESYERKPGYAALVRWLPLILLIGSGYILVFAVLRGDQLSLLINSLVMLSTAGHFFLNPAARPKNRARALEASRQVVAAYS